MVKIDFLSDLNAVFFIKSKVYVQKVSQAVIKIRINPTILYQRKHLKDDLTSVVFGEKVLKFDLPFPVRCEHVDPENPAGQIH